MGKNEHQITKGSQEVDTALRFQMFLDLSQEYLELVPIVESYPPFSVLNDSSTGRTLKRAVTLHAALGRKFISEKEVVSFQCLYRDLKGIFSCRDNFENFFTKDDEDIDFYRSPYISTDFEITASDGTILNSFDLYNDLRYGRLLHSDPRKWKKDDHIRQAWVGAIFQSVDAMQVIRKSIWDYRDLVIKCAESGWISCLVYDKEIKEERWLNQ